METLAIIVLVLIIIALGFYARILQRSLAEEERDACRLSREKEQEELAKIRAENDMKALLKALDEVLQVKSTALYCLRDISNIDWKQILGTAVEAIRDEPTQGTREELEKVLYQFWEYMNYGTHTFEEFMHELTTLPEAAVNRIIVKLSRG